MNAPLPRSKFGKKFSENFDKVFSRHKEKFRLRFGTIGPPIICDKCGNGLNVEASVLEKGIECHCHLCGSKGVMDE